MADEETATSTIRLVLEATDKITEPLAKMQEKIEGFVDQIRTLGISVAEIWGALEFVRRITEPAIELEHQMIRVSQSMRTSAEEQEQLKKAAVDLSIQFGLTAEDVARAEATFGQLGRTAPQTLRDTAIAAQLASATQSTAAESSLALGEAFTALADRSKPPADEMQRIAGIIAMMKTQFGGGQLSAAALGRQLVLSSGAMKALGVEANSGTAMLLELQRSGIGGFRGAAPMLDMITQRLLASKHGAAEFGIAIGVNTKGMFDLVATFEHAARVQPEALKAFIQTLGLQSSAAQFLVNNLKDLRETYTRTQDAAEQFAEITKRAADDPITHFAAMRAAITAVEDVFAGPLVRTQVWLSDNVTIVASLTAAWLEHNPVAAQAVSIFLGVTTVMIALAAALKAATVALALFGPSLMFVLSPATWALRGLMVLFAPLASEIAIFAVTALAPLAVALAPILAVTAALAALGAMAYAVYSNWATIKESWHVVMAGMLQDAMTLEEWLEAHWHPGEWIARQARLAIAAMKTLNEAHPATVAPAQQAAAQHESTWAKIRNTYGAAMEWIMPKLSAFGAQAEVAWTGVTNQFNQAVSAVAGVTAGPLSAALAPVAGAWSGISSAFGSGVDAVIGTAESALTYLEDALRFDPLQAAVGIVENAWSGIKGWFEAGKTAVISAMEALLGWLRDAKGWFIEAVQPLVDLFNALGAAMGSVGSFLGGIVSPGGAGAPSAGIPGVPNLPRAPRPVAPMFDGGVQLPFGPTSYAPGGGNITNAPTVNVTVHGDGDPDKIKGAVTDALSRAHEQLASLMSEVARGNSRTSFSDPAYGALA